MKTRLLSLAIAALPALAAAVPFDSSSSTTPATATVGTGGDYASLSAAASAFSTVASINRPWVLEILGNTTESANAYFGNTFGANGSLTIRPAPGTTPAISFINTANPTGWDGHLVLGAKNGSVINASTTPASSGRYTIDGGATPGGTSRDLTLQAGRPGTPLGSNSEILLAVVGDTDGAEVRNLDLRFYDSNGFGAALGLIAVAVAGNRAPDNCTVENCRIASGGGGNMNGILVSEVNGGGLPDGVAVEGLAVSGCEITTRNNGVLMLATGSHTIADCRIAVLGATNTGPAFSGITHQDANTVLGFVSAIRRNAISVSAPDDATGIALSPGGDSAGLYIVENNAIRALDITGLEAPTEVLRRGIAGTSAFCDYVIEHNSVSIAHQDNIAPGGNTEVVGIALTEAINAPRTATVRNNIVRNAQDSFGATALYYAWYVNVASDANCLWSPQASGWVGGSQYVTLEDWQIGGMPAGFFGFDDNGQATDPAATAPPWDAELHFARKPEGMATVPASSFLTDIDGQPRPFTGAYPGADEPVIPNAFVVR